MDELVFSIKIYARKHGISNQHMAMAMLTMADVMDNMSYGDTEKQIDGVLSESGSSYNVGNIPILYREIALELLK